MSKPKAIMIDLDGTLCNIMHRVHHVKKSEGEKKDWKSFFAGIPDDDVNQWCLDIMNNFKKDHKILICTGRAEYLMKITMPWLEKFKVPFDRIYMRPNGSKKEDFVIKEQIYKEFIQPNYDVSFAVDDRQQVVDAWRRNGIVTLQCAHGNY